MKIFNLLKKKAKGVIAVEWVITCPFAMLITFFSVLILIFTIDFHLVSKNASQIVSDLNMGDTGYNDCAKLGEKLSSNIEAKKYSMNWSVGSFFEGPETTAQMNITLDSGKKFYNSAKYFVHEINNNGGFDLPYCQTRTVNVRVYDKYPNQRTGFSTSKWNTESGDMIIVQVDCLFCGVIPFRVDQFGFIN